MLGMDAFGLTILVLTVCAAFIFGVLFGRKNPKDAQMMADTANKAKAEADKLRGAK